MKTARPSRSVFATSATLVGATLIALIALSGCTSTVTSQVDGPVIAITGQLSGDSNASGMQGSISLTEGCLLLGDSVLVWPEGTSWDDRTEEVVRIDGTRIGVGDQVLAGGDPLDDLGEALGDDGAEAIEACGGAAAEPTQTAPDEGRAVIVAV